MKKKNKKSLSESKLVELEELKSETQKEKQ